MASNQEILSSILEFLLLQPTPNSILNPIFVYLPISPPFSPRLLKSLLLRHLCQRPFSPQTLTSLELVEQLDRDHLSQPPSKSLQLAYSAVAVHLTVRFLRNDGRREGELGDFFDAVNMIWNIRVGDLEEGEGKGLVSETLREERRLMEKAVGDVVVRGVLRRMDTGGEAEEAVGVYVREAVKEMGPTVIVKAAVEEVRRLADGKESGDGQNEPAFGGDCLTRICSHLPLPSVIQENQLKQGVEMDRSMVEEPLPAILQTVAGISTVGTRNVSNHERMEENQSHLPLPNVIQENQLKQGVEMDRGMVEESLPAILQAAAGISTVGTGDVSNHERMEENQSHLPLPNVIQESQLKQGVEMDRSMVEEPLPALLQAAAGMSTVGTGDVSNHERMEENESLMDCDQAPSADKGPEIICARDVSSGMHNRVHDTSLQPSSVNQNQSELYNGEANQNVVSGNATASSIDKCMVTHSREDKITLIGKKRDRVDDTIVQPSFIDQYPTECENGEENQNAVSGNAMVCSLDKGTVALNTAGESRLIGKKRESVHDTGLQPSLTAQSPTERENGEENHITVSGNARVSSHDKGKVAIHTDGTSTSTGTKDSHALRKTSIMDRNPTARTQKWHADSAESSPGTSPNPSEKVQIPRRKRTGVSNMKIPWNREFAGRRKKKWWTPDEEDTLRKAVEMFGVGSWALIKNSYPAMFEDRSSWNLGDHADQKPSESKGTCKKKFSQNEPAIVENDDEKKGRSCSTSMVTVCQIEKCMTDLSEETSCHRRHNVCAAHSKAMVAGPLERFCQQCRRFHDPSEFDKVMSCRS